MSSVFTLTMPESTRRARPNAMPYNPATLRALAANVSEHAKKIAAAAELLENAGPALSVSLNHTITVEAGMAAIRSLVREVEEKVDNKKFLKITDERPESKAPPVKGKKRP